MEKDKSKKYESSLRFFTSSEVAGILKMNPQVIARKLLAGDLEGYKIGKDWRVSEAQLFAFLERHSNQKLASDQDSKIIQTFFKNGCLKSIPTVRNKRVVVLKYLVSKLDQHKVYSENDLNKFLVAFHPDVCTLRREFIMNKLMVRKSGNYKVIAWNR